MRIIDKEIVKLIEWTNSEEYDKKLSQLCQDGDHFLVINPELDNSVLNFININLSILDERCIKYKVGEGWVAKRFPPNWNGGYKIVQVLPTPITVTFNKFAKKDTIEDYTPNAWDLKFKHVWTYDQTLSNNIPVEAVTVSYIEEPIGTKFVGNAIIDTIDNNFDVIFLSYNEEYADKNWKRVLEKCPTAKRVNGIKGIYNAHKHAAEIADTNMFYVIDADAWLVNNFKFSYIPLIQDRSSVHIWMSRNPVNGLGYGYGGVKLFSKDNFLLDNSTAIDVSTSLGAVKIISEIACETRFNTDSFNSWKSAFRECTKLASSAIINEDKNTRSRLEVWCRVGKEKEFGNECIAGAKLGKEFGITNKDNASELCKINDFDWLKEKYNESISA
jgi:hypothetical protein